MRNVIHVRHVIVALFVISSLAVGEDQHEEPPDPVVEDLRQVDAGARVDRKDQVVTAIADDPREQLGSTDTR